MRYFIALFFILIISLKVVAVKKIITIYDSENEKAVLYKKAKEIDFSKDTSEGKLVEKELLDKAREIFPASGLAAPQIGISKRAFIYSWDASLENIEIVINPKIILSTRDIRLNWEGCFSAITDDRIKIALVPRPSIIHVEYFDSNGNKKRKVLKDFTARIFLHEYDHLEGIIYDMHKKNKIVEFTSKQDMYDFLEKERIKYPKNASEPEDIKL